MFSRHWIGPIAFVIMLTFPLILFAQEEFAQEAVAEKEVSGNLQVIDAVMATGIENLLPEGLGTSFSSTVGTLYAFT